ncbi:MAG TPA: toxin [Alphaproteobacteria bacterium]|nr:toxin [Alphaproteobacteria bacterium]HQS94697.1 toxin [Alphaproteobacteria bacterium]
MKITHYNFTFSTDKNLKLIHERGISFEAVIAVIESGYLVDVIQHPNATKYPHQKVYIVVVNEYVYLVPFVIEEEGTIFLKTIIPSRKAKKKYLKELKENETN